MLLSPRLPRVCVSAARSLHLAEASGFEASCRHLSCLSHKKKVRGRESSNLFSNAANRPERSSKGPDKQQLRWHSVSQPAASSSFYASKKLDPKLAYIGVGSNVGNRLRNIEDALLALRDAGIHVKRTSGLYETAPMYVEEQASFFNAVFEVEIPDGMAPHDMLAKLKTLEDQLGREKTIDKGPRSIDLDILLFGTQNVDAPDLVIPHHSMQEREFVLRPLADLIPDKELPHRQKKHKYAAVSWYLNSLAPKIDSPLVPLRAGRTERFGMEYLRPTRPERSTKLMGIVNLTPDSFSDGGKISPDPKDKSTQSTLEQWLNAGVSIIDIGGCSTRPHAAVVSEDEEIARVVPLIRAMRKKQKYDNVAISVDTFRASVARAAVKSGADIVNDVSAGQLDPDMLKTVAELQCTYMMMHMRGDSSTMMELCDYPEGVITGIGKELQERLKEAEKAGIPRWRIILDPGIGFSKKQYQNVQILARLGELRDMPGLHGYPWLVGPSRKRFLAVILKDITSGDLDRATAAAVTAAVQGGADVVRVHNSRIKTTLAIADAIYRNPSGEGILL